LDSKSYPILLVEDDEALAKSLTEAMYLGGLANPIHWVPSAEEAMGYLQRGMESINSPPSGGPVCILSDQRLPGRSGLELLEWVRQQPSLQEVPVMMLTVEDDAEVVDRAYGLGASCYMLKPLSFQSFLGFVAPLGLQLLLLRR